MTDPVDIAKNSLDVLDALNGAFLPGLTDSGVSNIINWSATLAPAIPFLATVLAFIGTLLPDDKHEEIISRFDELSYKVDRVKDDIERLRIDIKWDSTEQQYARVVTRIESGIEYCLEIGKTSRNAVKLTYHEKLKALCGNHQCDTDLRDLLDGMIGTGIFRSGSILDKLYDKTGGDRPKISAFATRLAQLAIGGLLVVSTHTTMMNGMEGAKVVTDSLYRRLKEACSKVQPVLIRCKENFKENMLNDLNTILDKGGSTEVLINKLSDFVRDKYDWMENYCLVYDDVHGSDKHWIRGYYVHSFHRNGKCAVIFYQDKIETLRHSNRYEEAYRILTNLRNARDPGPVLFDPSHHAKEINDRIVERINWQGIEWRGCAVVTRHGTNFRAKTTFSSTAYAYFERWGTVCGFWTCDRSSLIARTILLLK